MIRYRTLTTWALGSVILLTSAASTAALTPQEVLVVANGASPESAELARYYARARGIPKEQILLLNTTTEFTISQSLYETQIRRPVKEYLVRSGLQSRIRCLCLIWGVPVRVSDDMMDIYNSATTIAHRDLAVTRKALGLIGKDFTVPKSAGPCPLADLFAVPPSGSEGQLMKAEDLRKEVSRLLMSKQIEVGRIADASRRLIASRQFQAAIQEASGLKGLLALASDAKVATGLKAEDLKSQLVQAEKKLAELNKSPASLESARSRLTLVRVISGASGVLLADEDVKQLKPADATVDSELALLWNEDYPLAGMMPNPLYWKASASKPSRKEPPTLLTARIDGPSEFDCRQIIRASIAAEASGLPGTCYIDCGGLDRAKAYDENARELYRFLLKAGKVKAVIDESREVFQPGSCPNAALYVGWYSYRKYVPAFVWQQGAVGWHVSSGEAEDLRNPDSQHWCPQMIRNGVAATIGSVGEPYLRSFPLPQEFFPLLLTGKYTVAECYFRTAPFTSWRMTLIADPLYNPYVASPQVRMEQLPKGLAP